jgi:hypothetical protein
VGNEDGEADTEVGLEEVVHQVRHIGVVIDDGEAGDLRVFVEPVLDLDATWDAVTGVTCAIDQPVAVETVLFKQVGTLTDGATGAMAAAQNNLQIRQHLEDETEVVGRDQAPGPPAFV